MARRSYIGYLGLKGGGSSIAGTLMSLQQHRWRSDVVATAARPHSAHPPAAAVTG
jgi:hypothetical protein